MRISDWSSDVCSSDLLASDGGLYVPESWPSFSADQIRALSGLSYVETAVRVMTPFVAGSLGEEELRELCAAAYGRFSHDAVTPLVQLDDRHWLLELFHGPTQIGRASCRERVCTYV